MIERFSAAGDGHRSTAELRGKVIENYGGTMENGSASDERLPVHLPSGAGRAYEMGRIRAVFKADGGETADGYSISEWWLEAHTKGPGIHSHAEDDVFYVLEGTMSILLGERWVDANRGSFVLIPGGTPHDFENRTAERAGVLNFSNPGGFESEMPAIRDWFLENPPGSV